MERNNTGGNEQMQDVALPCNRKEKMRVMRDKLLSLGIGCETLKVFGAVRCNVHVTCVSRNTADKWVQHFNTIFKGSKVSLIPTDWEAAKNVGGNLTPTMRKGFLIAVTIQPQKGDKK